MSDLMTEHQPRMPARALILLLAVGLLLISGEAAAQITISQPPEQLHNTGGMDLIASRADCEGAKGFTWTFSGLTANDNVSIWASSGDDCTQQTNRNSSTGTCKKISDAVKSSGQTLDITVGVDEMAKAYPDDITGCLDSASGNVTRPTTIYFLVNESGSDVSNATSATVTLDFIGPSATTLTSLAPKSATSLNANWNAVEGESDPSYTLYCAVAIDGSEAGGTSDDGTCAATELVPDELPPSGGCGDSSGTSGEATNLEEGTLYAIGVAAVDYIDNPGFLSNLRCASPEPVVGFYDTIGDVNGLCTIARVSPTPTRWGWVVVGLGAAGLVVARRRRHGAR